MGVGGSGAADRAVRSRRLGPGRGRRADGGRRPPMEDAVSELLPGSVEVAFVDLPATAEATIATVVIVAPRDLMHEAADALAKAAASGGVRAILIVADAGAASTRVRVASEGILIEGLKPEHFDNAVAALRLSSLPTLVWWRGGSSDVLRGLAVLADRVVLDATDPTAVWPIVPQLA